MKRLSILLLSAAFLISSCKKTDTVPAPNSSFDIPSTTIAAVATVAQYSSTSITNNSVNGVSYLWDFGDGTTSKDKAPAYTPLKTGKFTISLTVTNADGKTSTTTKQVNVLAPVMTNILVNSVNFTNPGVTGTPILTKADIWLEITKKEKGSTYQLQSNGSYNAPVVFKSLTYKDATATSVEISLGIPAKFIVDARGIFNYDELYAVHLYAKDASGTYLISSSEWSGSGFSFNGLSYNSSNFNWTAGELGTIITLSGNYQ